MCAATSAAFGLIRWFLSRAVCTAFAVAGLTWGLHAVAAPEAVRTGTWTEYWPDTTGVPQARNVTGEIWTDVFQAALDRDKALHIAARDQPYYIDAPLVLRSGCKVVADAKAEIRLKPGTNTCMVRNASIVGFAHKPVSTGKEPDADLLVEGGIWTTLATSVSETNGNRRGQSSPQEPVPGTHGVILLHNVRKVVVRDVTVRQCKAFAVHLGNVDDFLVEGVTLDEQRRDGVHVNGPASNGVVRKVHGDSADDTVALNAWDWQHYTPSFGPIHHVNIDDVVGVPEDKRSANSIRLLPGVKVFADGNHLDCPIHDITVSNVTDIREFKLYSQPNLEMGRDKDFSRGPGVLRGVALTGLVFNHPGVIQVAADVDGLSVSDVDLRFDPAPGFRLVEIGPMSATYRPNPDPASWAEIFNPDLDVTVSHFSLGTVSQKGHPVADALTRWVQVKDQHLNPEYPRTTPRGGSGKALLVP